MHGAKLQLAKEATRKALGLLGRQDRFSLVVYDEQVDVLVESTTASAESLDLALRKLDAIEARGSTDLGTGWLKGCEQVAAHLTDEAVGRCLLLTDGLANAGITGQDALSQHAAELQARHVATSTFGVGADFDERLLAAMARAGGGNFYYIEAALQIPDLLDERAGRGPGDRRPRRAPGRERTRGRLPPFAERLPFRAAGEQPGVLPPRSERPPGDQPGRGGAASRRGPRVTGSASSVRSTTGRRSSPTCRPRRLGPSPTMLPTTASPATLWSIVRSRASTPRMRSGTRSRPTGAATSAAARGLLEKTAKRIEGYAAGDAELQQIARGLREAVSEFAESMDPAALKRRHFASYTVGRSRDVTGKSQKH